MNQLTSLFMFCILFNLYESLVYYTREGSHQNYTDLRRRIYFNSSTRKMFLNSLDELMANEEPVLRARGSNKADLSCIVCNNLEYRHCHAPRDQALPSMKCKTPTSKCYSMHTPFGIVDRGCIDLENNMTTFVCACNLCNHMHFYDMPYMFRSKRDWITNVYEIARFRHLRKVMHEEMSCLKCEVNFTAPGFHDREAFDCVEGIVSGVPEVLCKKNEVCGVKSIKSQGYVWRGCISFPLYNYYTRVCGSNDLCNNGPLASVYDE